MANGLTREDLQNPGKISGLLERAIIRATGSIGEQAKLLITNREACSERGYHRVETEPKTDDDLMICYDCELWFDRGFAKQANIKYRVELT